MGQLRLSARSAGPRWVALRIVSTLLKILAWLVGIAGFLGAIGLIIAAVSGLRLDSPLVPFAATGGPATIVLAISLLIGGILYFLILYAVSELIMLLIAIENNTRR